MPDDNPLRRLPPVSKVLDAPALAAVRGRHPADAVTAAVRAELAAARDQIAAGGNGPPPSPDALAEQAAARLDADAAPKLRPVINATGVVLHTNLGRSPLHESAARAAYEAGAAI